MHRLNRVHGAHIHAIDGEIGHLDDVIVDDRTLAIRYLVIDTSNFVGGAWVAIAPSAIRAIDWAAGRIDVDLTREAIKNGPRLESLDVPHAEAMPNYGFIF